MLDCCNIYACECKLHPQCVYEKKNGTCCPNEKGVYDPCCSNFRAAVNNPACEKAGVKGNACPDEKGTMHECCHADTKCSYKNQCPGLAGDCCPTPGGVKLGCCLNKGVEEQAAIVEDDLAANVTEEATELFLFSRRRRTGLQGTPGCPSDTGGSCSWFSCGASRRAECVNKKCLCMAGHCAVNGACVMQRYHQSHYHPRYHYSQHGRVAVDGHRCEHGWRARWPDGSVSNCRTFCCFHRNRRTGRRTRRSYCRVFEYGRQVLKACRSRYYMSLAEETEAEVDEDGEEDDEAELENVQQTFVVMSAACVGAVVMGGIVSVRALYRSRMLPPSTREPFLA